MPLGETRVLILAGGASRRMGADKADVRLGGRTLLERACACAGGTGYPVVLAGRERLTDGLPPGIEHCADGPGEGPVAGLLGGASRWPGASWVLIACDLPLLTPELLLRLTELANSHPAACAVVPRAAGRLHPLSAWYGPPMIDRLRRHARAGRFGLTEALGSRPSVDASATGEDPVLFAGAGLLRRSRAELADELLNCNRPEDLLRAREILHRRQDDALHLRHPRPDE